MHHTENYALKWKPAEAMCSLKWVSVHDLSLMRREAQISVFPVQSQVQSDNFVSPWTSKQ